MRARFLLLAAGLAAVLLILLLVWRFRSPGHAAPSQTAEAPTASLSTDGVPATKAAEGPGIKVYAHNLMLRKGPDFRVYIRWLAGQITPASRKQNPSFDDPDSFFIDIKTGVLRANIGDIGHYLNASLPADSPLKNIRLSGFEDKVRLQGTLRKVFPLPIQVDGQLAALPGNRIQIHVTKLSVLKVPLKGLLGGFHVSVADLFHPSGISGIEVSGNDIFLDTQKLLPAPHIRGQLTAVRVVNPDLEEVYGNATTDVARVEQWRNFLRLRDGTLDFGKLTMHHVDLVMVDISSDAWFDLDLAHYQDQLVNGYTRMTPQAGLQIFMPDLSKLPPKKASQSISMEWLKHRNTAPPPDVMEKAKH